MRNWVFSLQFRLIASFALVLSLALGGVSVYIGLAADREADRLQSRTDQARAWRIEQTLAQFYLVNKGWGGLQPMLERAGFLAGRDIVVFDQDGEVVGDTSGTADSSALRRKGGTSPVVVDRNKVGTVLIGHGARDQRFELFGRRGAPPWTRFAEASGRPP